MIDGMNVYFVIAEVHETMFHRRAGRERIVRPGETVRANASEVKIELHLRSARRPATRSWMSEVGRVTLLDFNGEVALPDADAVWAAVERDAAAIDKPNALAYMPTRPNRAINALLATLS